MTAIIRDWLHKAIAYDREVPLEKGFSNGYFLGKLLHSYGLQKDFNLFRESDSLETKLSNFIRLGTTMNQMGIRCSAYTARDIIHQKPGVVDALLYELYVSLHNKLHMGETLSEKSFSSKHTDLLELKNSYYQHQLRQLIPRQCDSNLTQLIARFEARKMRNEQLADYNALKGEVKRVERVQGKRNQLLERSRQIRLAQSELMAKLEANIVDLPKRSKSKQSTETEPRTAQHTDQGLKALQEIEEFEAYIQSRDITAGHHGRTKPQTTDLIGQLRLLKATSETKAKVAQMQRVDRELNPSNSEAYMACIRERVLEERLATMERQKRQRRAIVSSLDEQHAREEDRRTRQLAERLQRQSQLERRLCVQLEQTRHEKAVILANRLEREKANAEQREAEFQAAMDLERERQLERKKEEANTLAILREAWANQKAKRRQEAYTRHYNFVSTQVVELMVQFSTQVAEYRAFTGKLIPETLFRQWKAQFVEGVPFWRIESEPSESAENADTKDATELIEKEQHLDECELTNYQNLLGDWDLCTLGTTRAQPMPGAASQVLDGEPIVWASAGGIDDKPTDCVFHSFNPERPEANPIFDWIVERLHELVYPRPPSPAAPKLPELPIRAAILGKPLSGKTSIISQLATSYSIVIIDPEQLVKEALDAYGCGELEEVTIGDSSMNSTEMETPICYAMTRRAQFGKRIDEELQVGNVVSDSLLVDLVFENINLLPDGSNFILDNFPTNITQARLLHQRLTVSETDPPSTDTPQDSMTNSTVASLKPSVRRGLDIALLIDLPDDHILQRAALLSTQTPDPQDDQTNTSKRTETTGEERQMEAQLESKSCQDPSWLTSLHERLDRFETAWTEMEAFYMTELQILQKLEPRQPSRTECEEMKVDRSLNDLCQLVERLLQDVIHKREVSMFELQKSETELTGVDRVEESVVDGVLVAEKTVDTENSITAQDSLSQLQTPEPLQSGDSGEVPSSSRRSSARIKSARSSSKSKDKAEVKKTKTSSASKRPPSKTSDKPKRGSARSVPVKEASDTRSRSRSGSVKRGSGRTSKRSSGKAKLALPDEQVHIPLEISMIVSPKPGEEGWTYVDEPILQDCAIFLMKYHENSEGTYSRNCQPIFRALRQVRSAILPHLYNARLQFYNYLQRPDMKQPFVSQFRVSFNSVLDEMRADEETRADLHCRTDDLRDQLYEILDETKAANEAKIQACINPSDWLTDKMCLLANFYLALMQVELSRFQDRLCLLKDYYRLMEKRPQTFESEPMDVLTGTVDCSANEYNRLPLLQLPETSSDKLESDPSRASGSKTPSSPHGRSPRDSSRSRRSTNRPRSQLSVSLAGEDVPPSEFVNMPPEFITHITLLHPKSSLAEIYAAMTKSGPGSMKPAAAASANPKAAKGGGGGGKQAAAPSGKPGAGGADKGASGLPNADALLVDKTRTPTSVESQFVFNTCLCALQIIHTQYNAERLARASEAEADGYPTGMTPKPGGNTTNAGGKGKRVSADKKNTARKSRVPTPKGKGHGKADEGQQPTTILTEEDLSQRASRDRIRREHLATLDSQVSSSVFRLTLVRTQACAMLAELANQVAQTQQAMTDWIGERTLKEHYAVNSLIELIRHTIETEQKLSETLVLDGEQFYTDSADVPLSKEKSLQFESTQSSGLKTNDLLDLGFFTLDQLKHMIEKFRTLAPVGYIPQDQFLSIIQPFIEHRLDQFCGQIDSPNRVELTTRLTALFQAPFEVDNKSIHPTVDQEDLMKGLATSLGAKETTVAETNVTLDANLDQTDGKAFYTDWHRFLLSATQSIQIFNPESKPNQAMLLDLVKRLLELDQRESDTVSGDAVGVEKSRAGLLGAEVTREQFEFAPFPWYGTNSEYFRQLQDIVFTIFAKPTTPPSSISVTGSLIASQSINLSRDQQLASQHLSDSVNLKGKPAAVDPSAEEVTQDECSVNLEDGTSTPTAKTVQCDQLLLHLSIIDASTPYTGFLRALTALLGVHVPHFAIPGHEDDTLTQQELEGVPDFTKDPLIPKIVLEKLLRFGLVCVEDIPGTQDIPQVLDAVDPVRNSFADKLTEIYNELRENDTDVHDMMNVPFSRLLQHPEFVGLLLSNLPRFQLPRFPEPWPTLLRLHFRPATASTSTIYDDESPRAI